MFDTYPLSTCDTLHEAHAKVAWLIEVPFILSSQGVPPALPLKLTWPSPPPSVVSNCLVSTILLEGILYPTHLQPSTPYKGSCAVHSLGQWQWEERTKCELGSNKDVFRGPSVPLMIVVILFGT